MKTNLLKGIRLQDGEAHQAHHRAHSRRSFLSTLGRGGAGALLLGNIPVAASAMSPLTSTLLESEHNRILVLIQLNGGNDGLNTTIPLYDYDYYRSVRPGIAHDEGSVIKLSDEIGLQSGMIDLKEMWDEGAMKVVHNVGYPDSSLSHFRGTDIWNNGSTDPNLATSGWLGRWLDEEYPNFAENPPEIPPALQIGSFGSLALSNSMVNFSVNVSNPEELAEIGERGELYDVTNVPTNCYGDELRFLRTITNSTFIYAETIKEAYDAGQNDFEYEDTYFSNLGEQLALVARLIKGDLGTRIFMVNIGSFDTHADQLRDHPRLWQSLSENIKKFYDDLQGANKQDEVLTMTFSEFGRRIEENGTSGTDHGTSAPLFLFGPGLNDNGFHGEAPDLQDQDMNGNLKFGTDFRSVYASVLEHWLCVDGAIVDQVMGVHHARIESLLPGCGMSTSTPGFSSQEQSIVHRALYSGNGEILIEYQLPKRAKVLLEIYDVQGRKVNTLVDDQQMSGTHSALMNAAWRPLFSGNYVYALHVDGRNYSRLIQVGK